METVKDLVKSAAGFGLGCLVWAAIFGVIALGTGVFFGLVAKVARFVFAS